MKEFEPIDYDFRLDQIMEIADEIADAIEPSDEYRVHDFWIDTGLDVDNYTGVEVEDCPGEDPLRKFGDELEEAFQYSPELVVGVDNIEEAENTEHSNRIDVGYQEIGGEWSFYVRPNEPDSSPPRFDEYAEDVRSILAKAGFPV